MEWEVEAKCELAVRGGNDFAKQSHWYMHIFSSVLLSRRGWICSSSKNRRVRVDEHQEEFLGVGKVGGTA